MSEIEREGYRWIGRGLALFVLTMLACGVIAIKLSTSFGSAIARQPVVAIVD